MINRINIIIGSVMLPIILLFSSSCISEKRSAIDYKGEITTRTKELKSEMLNDEFFFSGLPTDIIVNDSLLIVIDDFKQQAILHVFHKVTGDYIKSLGKRGDGPNEFITPVFVANVDNNNITLFDVNSRKLITVNIESELITNRNLKDNISPFTRNIFISPNKNTTFLKTVKTKEVRFGHLDLAEPNTEVKLLDIKYPSIRNDLDSTSSESVDVLNYGSMSKMSPNFNKMAIATYIGGLLEIYNIDTANKTILPSKVARFYKPEYKIDEYNSVAWSEETTFGFQHLHVDDNNIYVLKNGGRAKDKSFFPNEIVKFDWEGNPELSYNLDISISKFIVDILSQKIYAITFTEEDNPKLVSFDL